MIDLKKLQKEIRDNKVKKGFNVDNIELEFCYTYKELAEAFAAYHKKESDLGEELADVVIFILSLADMLDIDLEKEILNKIIKNTLREYKKVDGVNIRTKDA